MRLHELLDLLLKHREGNPYVRVWIPDLEEWRDVEFAEFHVAEGHVAHDDDREALEIYVEDPRSESDRP